MSTIRFFDAADQQNIIKTKLVAKYFGAWTTFMLPRLKRPTDRIAYIDLFSGPGRFTDGNASTPLWILNNAISRPELSKRLVTIFNDKDLEYAALLQAEIDRLPGIETLCHPPQVSNLTVGSQLVDLLQSQRLVPTLFFIDPWGYKGLSLELIGTSIKNWGCDCIFFFNYNRINPGLTNRAVFERMNDLFGVERAGDLRVSVQDCTPRERQKTIVDALINALGDVGGKYVLPFEFESDHGKRTSHYIIYVSKEFRGYHIMKEVMASLSSDEGEVKSFQHVPMRSPQMAFFGEIGRQHSISALQDLLAVACAGTTMTVEEIYRNNTVGTPYTLKNVKDALIALERAGNVTVDKPAERRMRKGQLTLGDARSITFLD